MPPRPESVSVTCAATSLTKASLGEEYEEDKYKKYKEPIHDQVQGVIFILFEKFSESFHY